MLQISNEKPTTLPFVYFAPETGDPDPPGQTGDPEPPGSDHPTGSSRGEEEDAPPAAPDDSGFEAPDDWGDPPLIYGGG